MKDTEWMGPFILFRTMVCPEGNSDWVTSVFKIFLCLLIVLFIYLPIFCLATVLGRKQG